MFEHLRATARPCQYVAHIERLGLFKWRWSVSKRTGPPPGAGWSWQDEFIISGTRTTKLAAEKVAAAMRDGFIAWPLPGDEAAE